MKNTVFFLRRIPLVAGLVFMSAAGRAGTALVESGHPIAYLANQTDPGIGLEWTAMDFDDSSWAVGFYGIGYETGSGANNLIQTATPAGLSSIYTRAVFNIPDVNQVSNLFLGVDYDDGYVAWINGVEVFRSAQMDLGALAWNSVSQLHESSNGSMPSYVPMEDITAKSLQLLKSGENLLAIGVWNASSTSSDLVLVPKLVMNPSGSLTRGPYLQMATPSSIVIRWRTSLMTNSQVLYGSSPDYLTQEAFNPTATTEHEVLVSGLSPGTKYYYSVGMAGELLSGADADHYFITPPVSGTPKPARIWVVGDSGTANADAAAVRDAYSAFTGNVPTDLWLMLGDNAYPDGTDSEYQAAVFDMYQDLLRTTALWSTLGNHDGHTADSKTESGPYYDIFTLPRNGEAGGLASGTEAYYSFDYGNIHFICLDSYETDRSTGGAMVTWLQYDLAATLQDWIIAFWHHPPYTRGSHNSDRETELIEMRENVLPILEDAGVDLVLSGHSHSYERSFLLDGHYGNSSTLTEAMKKNGGDGRADGTGAYLKPSIGPAPHEGTVYTVAGSSGKISGGSLDHPVMYMSLNVLGSLVLDISGNQMDVRFLDNRGVLRDYFRVIKGDTVPPMAPSNLMFTILSRP